VNLVQKNLLSSVTTDTSALAQQHAENAISILNHTWTEQIAERNHRVATDITKGLLNLKTISSTAAKSTSTKLASNYITEKVTSLNNLLDDEALSVRLTKDQMDNSTIQALALSTIVNKIDQRYANAFGIEYNDNMSVAMNMIGLNRGETISNMITTAAPTTASNNNNKTHAR